MKVYTPRWYEIVRQSDERVWEEISIWIMAIPSHPCTSQGSLVVKPPTTFSIAERLSYFVDIEGTPGRLLFLDRR
jgi:hypothetical protein